MFYSNLVLKQSGHAGDDRAEAAHDSWTLKMGFCGSLIVDFVVDIQKAADEEVFSFHF